jgi:hypothetical protein
MQAIESLKATHSPYAKNSFPNLLVYESFITVGVAEFEWWICATSKAV